LIRCFRDKLREAQERMEKREMFGKIVVTP
jgi:hypothetical protein